MKKLMTLTAVAAFALFLMSGIAGAEAEKISKIEPEQSIKVTLIIHLNAAGGIYPAEAAIKPGTTVVWVNDSRAQLELQFSGKQVTMACKSPVHFIVDEEGSFISDRIPEDSVASLCFIEKGEFPYVLRNVGGRSYYEEHRTKPQEFRGKIIVK
jgi:hypothetical protein